MPLILAGSAIWLYWAIVLAMAAFVRFVRRRPSALTPHTASERAMWIIWVPVVVAWNAMPALALRKDDPALVVPPWAKDSIYNSTRWVAGALILSGLLCTMHCWWTMGRSWSVALVEGERTALVQRGLFRFVRHPIYGLSLMMMLCTLAVLPTWPMALAAMAHVVLMNLKARGEESHLMRTYGDAYGDYRRRTGRFLPRV